MRIISSGAPRAFALAALLIVVSPSLLRAQTWSQVGERAQGMGGAFVAVADDASAAYWNPAGLATGGMFDAQLELNSPKGTVESPAPGRKAFVGVALPVLALSYYQLRPAVSSSADRKNEGSGEVRVSTLDTSNFGVSLVQTVKNKLVMGSTLRLVNGGGDTSFDLDLGAMASLGNVQVGVTARNLRKSVNTERQVRFGAAFFSGLLPKPVLGPFSVDFDVDLTQTATIRGNHREAAVGSEQWWANKTFATRLGMHWDTNRAGQAAFGGGLTVKLPQSLFAEGHVTKGQDDADSGWGIGLRVTF
jgi:hypothetical protein